MNNAPVFIDKRKIFFLEKKNLSANFFKKKIGIL